MYPHKEAAFLTLSLISHQLQGKVARGTSMIATVLSTEAFKIPTIDIQLSFEEQWTQLHEYMTTYLKQFIQQFPTPVAPVAPATIAQTITVAKPTIKTAIKSPKYIIPIEQTLEASKTVALPAAGGKQKPKRRTLKKPHSHRIIMAKINKLKRSGTRIKNRR